MVARGQQSRAEAPPLAAGAHGQDREMLMRHPSRMMGYERPVEHG
jgi:hypothetical protein